MMHFFKFWATACGGRGGGVISQAVFPLGSRLDADIAIVAHVWDAWEYGAFEGHLSWRHGFEYVIVGQKVDDSPWRITPDRLFLFRGC